VSEAFIQSHLDIVQDFWRRRESEPEFAFNGHAYGYPYRMIANDAALLEAAACSMSRYTLCAPIADGRAINLRFVFDRRLPDVEVPADLPSRLRYMAAGPWLAVNAEPWVNSFADVQAWTGVAFVSSALAQRPRLYSRFIGDCFVLNMLMRSGWGQLHASCLYRDGRAVLLSAPNNSGKSTTALRLAMNGYQLVSDGMTYSRTIPDGIELLGYPVGEAKLRMDMLDEFPEIRQHGEAVLVREDTKMVFNLRQAMPERMLDTPIRPRDVVLCLLQRTSHSATTAEPISREEALLSLLPESSFVDDMPVMLSNLTSVQSLLSRARCYRLYLGHAVRGILDAVEHL
jgi:hypothetical protein